MYSKKIKIILTISALTACLLLSGCSKIGNMALNDNEVVESDDEMLARLMNGESIEIIVAEPVSIEQGTEITYEWKELAYLDNYEDFRFIFDDILAITNHGSNGKNGAIYADLEGNHTDNSTLYYAFMNRAFVEKYWNNTDVAKTIANAAGDIYTDLSNQHESLLAGYNAYYNLIPDSEPGFANMQSTMTRLEALSFLYKCDTPVQELETDTAFLAKVGDNVHTIFAQQIADQSYLKADNDSLDTTTANGTITRAEFIYTLVQRYYSDEYNQVTGKETCYSDAKNGGDIALKQKYIKKDKETGNLITPNKWQSYELSYSLQNPDKGMPDDLYKALVVAYNHNLIDSDESNWELGLTKYDAMKFVTTVYEDLTSNDKFIMNVDRGESIGTVVETNPEVTAPAESAVADSSVALTNDYYTKDENGKISVSEDFYSSLQAYSFFEGATVTEVNDYLTENEYLLAPLDPLVNDTAWFKEVMDMQGENGKKLHEEEVVTTKPAEKPAQQTQKPVQQEPVQQPAQPSQQEPAQPSQQEPVQQPVQPSQQEPVIQEPAPTLTPEEAAKVAENDAWLKQQEEEAARRSSDTDRWSGIDHGDYTSY